MSVNFQNNVYEYETVEGDTLENLALACYGDAAAAVPLALANGLAKNTAISVGDSIKLPFRVMSLLRVADQVADISVFLLLAAQINEITPHFAPGEKIWNGGDPQQKVDGEQCTIKYTVIDPTNLSESAALEISRKSDPNTVLFKKELTKEEFCAGEHETTWDGKCSEGEHADKYIDVLGSPYLVKIKLTADPTGVREASRETAVLLAEILIERGASTEDMKEPAQGSLAYYQYRLEDLGFHPGPIDGVSGTKTSKAIKGFQNSQSGLRANGKLDQHTKLMLEGNKPSGSGTSTYQFILNAIGYGCGPSDGIRGKNTKRAVRHYRADKGLPPGENFDAATKAALDSEAIPGLERREILEGDRTVGQIRENPFPAVGAIKKLYIDGDTCLCPGSLPYRKKYGEEKKNLIRPHFPAIVRPLVKKIDDTSAFSAQANGALQIAFGLDTSAPTGNMNITGANALTFVQTAMAQDGDMAVTGHHTHENRGGVRKSDNPGVYMTGSSLKPFDVSFNAPDHLSTCVSDKDSPWHGTAGINFVPSNIAGDRFAIHAKVHHDGFDTPPTATIEKKTGFMEVYRRYRVAKRWLMSYVPRPHRCETATQLGLPQWYDPAYIEFVEPVVAKNDIIRPRQADKENIDLTLFTALIREAGYRSAQLSDAAIQTRFNANILWPLQPAAVYNAANEQAYYDAIDSEIMAFEDRFASTLRDLSYFEAPEGLIVLVFDENAPRAGTMGINAISNANLQSWSWSLLASTATLHLIHDQDTASGTAINGETLAHEFGHALWLHHATTSSAAGALPHPSDQAEHNPVEYNTCTMSYIALPNFCGRCVLKLRGWDESKI